MWSQRSWVIFLILTFFLSQCKRKKSALLHKISVSCLKLQLCQNNLLTTKYLHPSANVEDSWRVKDEEEHHTADTKQNNNNRQSYEDRSGSKCWCWDRIKVCQFALTDDILTILHHSACLPESEVSSSSAFLGVSKPVGLDENHHHNYGKTNSEDPP